MIHFPMIVRLYRQNKLDAANYLASQINNVLARDVEKKWTKHELMQELKMHEIVLIPGEINSDINAQCLDSLFVHAVQVLRNKDKLRFNPTRDGIQAKKGW